MQGCAHTNLDQLMRTATRYALLFLIAFTIAVPQLPYLAVAVGVEEAHAAQKKRKTLFDVLFKRRKKKRKSAKSNSRPATNLPGVKLKTRNTSTKKKVKRKASKRSGTAGRTRPKPAVVVVKNENAAKILVVGDFIASALANGLERQYADNTNIVIVNRGKANSGIVRDDVIDWPSVIPTMIEEEKPIAIIALVGMNDRQQMKLETGRVEKHSEAWTAAYKTRITKIATSGASAKIPLLWVGLPPVKFNKMNTDYLVFNEMYRSISESIGGSFIDVWDGFTNAEGKYVSAGPDVNGRIVRLRGSKGINMTRAGRRKLAFFADKALRKLGIVGSAEDFVYASLGTINLSVAQPGVPEYDPAQSGKTVVLPLNSPALDGGDALEGEADFLKAKDATNSVSYDLVSNGKLRKPQPGRIDANWGIPVKEVEPSGEDTRKPAAKIQPVGTVQ